MKKHTRTHNSRMEHYLCVHIFQTFELSIWFWMIPKWKSRDFEFRIVKFLQMKQFSKNWLQAAFVNKQEHWYFFQNLYFEVKKYRHKCFEEPQVNYHFIKSFSCPANQFCQLSNSKTRESFPLTSFRLNKLEEKHSDLRISPPWMRLVFILQVSWRLCSSLSVSFEPMVRFQSKTAFKFCLKAAPSWFHHFHI